MRTKVLLLTVSGLLVFAAGAHSQTVVRPRRMDTVNAERLSSNLVDRTRTPAQLQGDFLLARRLVMSDQVGKAAVVRERVAAALETNSDPLFVSRSCSLLLAGAEVHEPWRPRVAVVLRRVLAAGSPITQGIVLECAKSAPVEVRDALVRPAEALLLATQESERQDYLAVRLVMLGEAGRAAFERLAASGQLSARVVSWVRLTTGGSG